MQSFLSQTAEYALRAMAWMAASPHKEPIRAQDMSKESGIPAHYLSKILRRMVLAGLLESRKGHGGGFELARPPEQILFKDILAAVDAYPSPGTPEHCAFGWGNCDPAHPCPLHIPWSRLHDSFHEWASTTTLAEVLEVPIEEWKALRTAKL